MAATNCLKVLRLRSGTRYVIAVQGIDGHIAPLPYWSAEQALTAVGVSPSLWHCVETEVFVEAHPADLPPASVVFVRRNRRRKVMGAVLWRRDRLCPTLFSSMDDALQAASHQP